jgi:hypothetical protein
MRCETTHSRSRHHTIQKMVRRVLLATAIVLIAVPASAQTVTAPRPSAAQRRVQHLLWRAYRDVARAHPRCDLEAHRPRMSHDAPPPALLRRYGVLRRPAGGEDALPAGARRDLEGKTVFVDWVRVVHVASGQSFYVVPGLDTEGDAFGPPGCERLRALRLRHLAADEPSAVRRIALRWARQTEAFAPPRHVVAENALWVYPRSANGKVGNEVASATFSHSSSGIGTGPLSLGHGRTLFVRLVRDGAATATGVFGRRSLRFGGRPRVYPSRLTLTVPIVDNLVAIEVPRPEEGAFPDRLIFRAADGTVVGTDPATDW